MLGRSLLTGSYALEGTANSQRQSSSLRGACGSDRRMKSSGKDFFGTGISSRRSISGYSLGSRGIINCPSPASNVRMMAGKGRSYPGGVTKWQWKRRQSKEESKLERERLVRDRKFFKNRRREELKDAKPWTSVLSATQLDKNVTEFRAITVNSMSRFGCADFMENLGASLPFGAATQGRPITRVDWSKRKNEAEQVQLVRSFLKNKVEHTFRPKHELTASSFEKLQLSPLSLKALDRVLGVGTMTRVQEATLPSILQGEDFLVRARGGTDEIVAALLHGVEVALKTPQSMTVSGRHTVNVLLVCPTREQNDIVAAEARKLLMFHSKIRVQVVMGGSDIKDEMTRLRRFPCEILVATPGRLLANLQQSAEFRGQLQRVQLLVLHDVQKLVDMGYRQTIGSISSLLPRTRQTLMLSTSLSDEVRNLSHLALKKDSKIIDTCEGVAEVASPMGKQELVVVPMEMLLSSVLSILREHMQRESKGKVVVFCQTIRATTLLSELYRKLGFYTREIHIRKKESERSRISAEFRTSQSGIVLFTSGASVWGVTNPDVTLIVQVGSPSAREQYVRRVTPTGPTTKDRHGVLVLMPHEESFVNELDGLPVSKSGDLEFYPELEQQVQRALEGVHYQIKSKAYIAWLRYHFVRETSDKGREKIVRLARVLSTGLGFRQPPTVTRKTVGKIGLERFLHILAPETGNQTRLYVG